ncbi:hypothetical protein [Lentilactobacillus otakiensis]|uniref:hypothetical protein n=1 Tax=Lentilactobacillus otakiensis TaxID=481720 RepID=UPI003D170137
MENCSNYELYTKLTATSFASGLVSVAARHELERRADNGDGEAKMLLELHKLQPAKKPLHGQVVHSINPQPRKRKFIYTLRLKLGD